MSRIQNIELPASAVSQIGKALGKDFRSHEEIVAEVLGRWSVSDLVEQTNADLARADELFYKSDSEFLTVAQGKHGLISWWKILSKGRPYEVRRFKNFCFCSCKSFGFSKRACKHIALSANVLCANCGEFAAKYGKLCLTCHTNKARFAPDAAIKMSVK